MVDKIKILAKVTNHYEDLLAGYFTDNDEPVITVKEAMKAMELYHKKMLNSEQNPERINHEK